MGEEAGEVGGPLSHVLLFVILVAFVWLRGRHNHIWIGLDEIVLEKVEIFILSAHLTSNVRDLYLERTVVLLVEEAARRLHQALTDHNLHNRSLDSREPGRRQLLRRDCRLEVDTHSTLMAGVSLRGLHRC